MLIFAVFLALMMFPTETHAHPGKTNYQGGHRCMKDCAEWDLFYQEYHLHDKHGRVVKVAKQRALKAAKKEAPEAEDAVAPPEMPLAAEQAPQPTASAAAIPGEEAALVLLPWVLIALLLLLLLARRKRRSGAE